MKTLLACLALMTLSCTPLTPEEETHNTRCQMVKVTAPDEDPVCATYCRNNRTGEIVIPVSCSWFGKEVDISYTGFEVSRLGFPK